MDSLKPNIKYRTLACNEYSRRRFFSSPFLGWRCWRGPARSIRTCASTLSPPPLSLSFSFSLLPPPSLLPPSSLPPPPPSSSPPPLPPPPSLPSPPPPPNRSPSAGRDGAHLAAHAATPRGALHAARGELLSLSATRDCLAEGRRAQPASHLRRTAMRAAHSPWSMCRTGDASWSQYTGTNGWGAHY